jgi:hypothetical protein
MRPIASRVTLAALMAALCLMALPSLAAVPNGPYHYYTVTPCRLVDTRNANGPSGGPILSYPVATDRAFPVQGHCGVPVGAKAVSVNLVAVQPTGPGYFTLYPSGIAKPLVASLNYDGGEFAVPNGGIVPLGDYGTYPEADLTIFLYVGPTGTAHMVLDVTGYFQ